MTKSKSKNPTSYFIKYTEINTLPYKYFDNFERSLQYKIDNE